MVKNKLVLTLPSNYKAYIYLFCKRVPYGLDMKCLTSLCYIIFVSNPGDSEVKPQVKAVLRPCSLVANY